MLDVVARSQRGRICELKRGDLSIKTPFIIREDSDNVSIKDRVLDFMGTRIGLDPKLKTSLSSGKTSAPICENGICITRLPVSEDLIIPDDCEVVIVTNGYDIRKDPRKSVDQIISLRNKVGYNRILCILGIADPSDIALYAYMGVDMFDDSLPRAMGTSGFRLIPEGEVYTGNDESAENILEAERECSKIHTFIKAGRLRELVDQRSFSDATSVATLRLFDEKGFEYQEEACSTVGCRFSCNTVQSLRRPDVKRYKEKIMADYIKPEHKRVLVLLPCSAKKPYHTSKSHKAFASAIHTTQKDTLVQELIVTSPLGVVPRELDVLYPASSYDIPVTGEWNDYEKKMIREMVGKVISQGFDKVICHLGEDYELVEGLAPMECTVVGDPTSPASIRNLDEAIRKATEDMEPVDYLIDRREAMRSVLRYQFGKEIADILMDEYAYAIGKFPYWKLMREDPEDRTKKVQLGMLTPERGMVSLTMEGAEFLGSRGPVVEILDFEMKGSLFAVGVVKADPSIRVGDEAILMCNGKVKGVGVAVMSGTEMTQMSRGVAVKTRHKSK